MQTEVDTEAASLWQGQLVVLSSVLVALMMDVGELLAVAFSAARAFLRCKSRASFALK